MAFYQKTQNTYLLRVRLKPSSSCCEICGMAEDDKGDDWLKISVCAAPEKGKANKELIEFLSKKLKVAKSRIEIVFGQTDRYKKVAVTTDDNIEQKLKELLK